ncbi:MAG: MFS transporter, partial [Clostridiales bacterium]|nr:MFS transporter [Clostridiales bacterium]
METARLNGEKGASYAWVILIVLFIGHAMGFGIRASFGVYVSPWEQEFLAGRSVVSSISMLSFFVFCVGQLLAGRLNDRFGKGIVPATGVFLMGASLILTSQADQIWKVVLLFGIGFSMGFAMCSNTVPSAIIANWFTRKRGFALGLIMSGFAVGQLILVPASLYYVEKVGWRGTMATLGIILIVAIGPLFVVFLRSKPEEKGLKPYGYAEQEGVGRSAGNINRDSVGTEGEKLLPAFGVFKLRVFWQLTIPYFICGFTDVG